MKTGAELIAAERRRQIEKEGWTAAHDDEHANSEMAVAAACYALPVERRRMESGTMLVNTARGLADPDSYVKVKTRTPRGWPWNAEWWKPCPDEGGRIRELVKAGALIAAEIDRLQRAKRPAKDFDHEAAHARAGYPDNR